MRRSRMHTRRRNKKSRKQRRKQRGGAIAINEYTTILGSGGFGLILSEPTRERVVKLYYNASACLEMNKEFQILQKAYLALQAIPIPQVVIPQPIQIDNRPFQYQGKDILCGIEMKRLQAIPMIGAIATNPMVHILLDDEGTAEEKARRYNEPIYNDNPSRGFFAGTRYIRDTILPGLTPEQRGQLTSLEAISKTMGSVFAALIGVGGIIPLDVEYCLVMYNDILHIAVLDFGMALEFPVGYTKEETVGYILKGKDGVGGAEYDIYFPNKENPLYPSFEAGMREVLARLENSPKKEVLADVITSYDR